MTYKYFLKNDRNMFPSMFVKNSRSPNVYALLGKALPQKSIGLKILLAMLQMTRFFKFFIAKDQNLKSPRGWPEMAVDGRG